jgi:hypothetical protein
MKAEQIIRNAMDNDPDIRLVLEIAERARAAELQDPARNIGVTTDIVTIPTNSQCLVPLATADQTRKA